MWGVVDRGWGAARGRQDESGQILFQGLPKVREVRHSPACRVKGVRS